MKRLSSIQYRAGRVLRAHQAFVVLLITLLILLITLLRVQTLNNIPINQTYIEQESANVKTVKFNQSAIEQIKSLRDSNVSAPGTNLPTDRQNPFSE